MAAVEKQSIQDKLLNYGLIALGVGAGIWYLKKQKEAADKDKITEGLASNPNAQIAQQLRAAFNPSGTSWLMGSDGTKTQTVLDAAVKVKDWKAVVKAYADLYQSNLADDLTNELTAEQLAKFYSVVGNATNGRGVPSTVSEGQFSKDNKFVFRVGQQVKSKPLAGGNKVGYYYIYAPGGVKSNVFKLYAWHQIPGGLMGTIKKLRKQTIIDLDKTKKDVNAYEITGTPLKNAPAYPLIVLERDIAKV